MNAKIIQLRHWAQDTYLAENTILNLKTRLEEKDWYNEGRSLHVSFDVPAEYWKRLKAKGNLGSLYGIDLGNLLSRLGILNEYAVPSVSDRKPCRGGFKHVSVTYALRGES